MESCDQQETFWDTFFFPCVLGTFVVNSTFIRFQLKKKGEKTKSNHKDTKNTKLKEGLGFLSNKVCGSEWRAMIHRRHFWIPFFSVLFVPLW